MKSITVDVFVVGAGPTGLACAALLARQGVGVLAITRYRGLADSPRAHITNQRAMEVFRDLGIAERVRAAGMAPHLMGRTVWATSFAGTELARQWSWGESPQRHSDYASASPEGMCNIPQHILEPILCDAAKVFGADIGFSTELVAMRQEGDRVISTCLDRTSGEQIEVVSRYAIGADGDRSVVCREMGFEVEGQTGLGHMVNYWIEADLSRYTAHRPAALYQILQPGGHFWSGSGVFVCVRTWNQWVMSVPYEPERGEPDLSESGAQALARQLVGEEDLPVKLLSVGKWSINRLIATSMRRGRVLIAGNAAHRHPPANGLGANTCVQDAFNLCWKLALVLKGQAGDGLLDTYGDERQPVGHQVVERAMKSVGGLFALAEGFGLRPGQGEEEGWAAIHGIFEDSPQGRERRERILGLVQLQDYCFNAQGVELGQFYRSTAIVGDGSEVPATRDPELFHTPSTVPGACLPHAWVERDRQAISTLDLVGHDRFTVITGHGGQAWIDAAEHLGRELGIGLDAVAIGPGLPVSDVYGDWARLRDMAEDGCLLVRPDRHIAFRARAGSATAMGDLAAALSQVLGQGR